MSDMTRLAEAAHRGDQQAAAALLPLVYNELRRLAAAHMKQEKPGHTLDATALVHEAYLRLVGQDSKPDGARTGSEASPKFANRRHFFAAAAESMRRILVENARRKARRKRGGGRQRQELASDLLIAADPNHDLLAVDAALVKLTQQDSQKARLIELRFFGGLTGEQAADVLGISASAADRQWVFARAWLRRELGVGQAESKPQPQRGDRQ